jgi:hypothetical protein
MKESSWILFKKVWGMNSTSMVGRKECRFKFGILDANSLFGITFRAASFSDPGARVVETCLTSEAVVALH